MYANYKYCTEHGNRVSVFASPTKILGKDSRKRTNVFILECSKSDNFSRRRAKEVYNNWISGRGTYYLTRVKPTYIDGRKQPTDPSDLPLNCIIVGTELYKVNHCTPAIADLPFETSHHAIDKYLRSFLLRFVSKSKFNEIVKNITSNLKSQGTYIEQ